jgi:hypothetical protein
MGGRHEINVMTAHLLKFNHHLCEVFIPNFLSSSFMGDGPVLAENAAEVTVGKEDGARSILTDQRHLLAEMGVIAENHRSHRSAAESLLPFLTIDPTSPWTEVATFENAIGLLNPLGQFTLSF